MTDALGGGDDDEASVSSGQPTGSAARALSVSIGVFLLNKKWCMCTTACAPLQQPCGLTNCYEILITQVLKTIGYGYVQYGGPYGRRRALIAQLPQTETRQQAVSHQQP